MNMERSELAALQTPCFILEREELRLNFEAFQQALRQHWGRCVLA